MTRGAWWLSRGGIYGSIIAGSGVSFCLTSDAPRWAMAAAMCALGIALSLVGGMLLFMFDRVWES